MLEKNILMKNTKSEGESFARLVEIIKILRKKCPWDKEQTHKSLRACMIEEAYEVCAAIDSEEEENLREELGDVLLQVVFHSIIEEENKKFDIVNVLNDISEKMIRRHPHIFSLKEEKSLDKVLEKWEDIKREEKQYETYSNEVDSVPKSLPALMRSYKVQKKADGMYSYKEDAESVMNRIDNDIYAIRERMHKEGSLSVLEHFEDLLFDVVKLSMCLNINPEIALMDGTDSFVRRFKEVDATKREGLYPSTISKEELEYLWKIVK